MIEIPSLARSPVAPVLFSLSDPAKSTKLNLAVNVSKSSMAVSTSLDSSAHYKIKFDKESVSRGLKLVWNFKTPTHTARREPKFFVANTIEFL